MIVTLWIWVLMGDLSELPINSHLALLMHWIRIVMALQNGTHKTRFQHLIYYSISLSIDDVKDVIAHK